MVKFLLLTANIGSLFDEERRILESWMGVVLDTIESEDADMVVLNMQETGGKRFVECSAQVIPLVKAIADKALTLRYTACRAYVDVHFEAEDYTALGSIFLIRETFLGRVKQFDFTAARFEDVNAGIEIYDQFDTLTTVIKKKFPKHFWPAIKWGRKGFLQTRWRFDQRVVDFVNVHLFHDESNLALIHENPSLYSDNRKRALNYVLDLTREENNGHTPLLFIFGDLNFRLNAPSFLNRLTAQAEPHPLDETQPGSITEVTEVGKKDGPSSASSLAPHTDSLRRTVSAIEFRKEDNDGNPDNNCVLRIEKKRFDYFNHKKLLNDWRSYLEDDQETQNFPSLHERPINFPPTYPWSEDPDESEMLMKTRAPAWCDRVLMGSAAWEVVQRDPNVHYDSLGRDTCTGDHKPVKLSFHVSDEELRS